MSHTPAKFDLTRFIKLAFLYACKFMGLFILFRAFNRQAVRILCYHGFAIDSRQSEFRPKLFFPAAAFQQRMEWLKRHRYNIVPLSEAVERLSTGEIAPDTVAITLDDGLYSVLTCGVPILKACQFPATLYVTTYFVEHQEPVFLLTAAWLFWLAKVSSVQTPSGIYDMARLQEFDQHGDHRQRVAVLREIAVSLGIDFDQIMTERPFHLLTLDEIRQMADDGLDIQLHTHRHRWPQASELLRDELLINAAVLAKATAGRLDHVCYPSGVYDPENWPILRELGIRSATTCDPGFNRAGINPLQLNRFLDGTDVAMIEFEAEMCGLLDFLRRRVKPRGA